MDRVAAEEGAVLLVEQVRVLRPAGSDPAQVVGQRRPEPIEGGGAEFGFTLEAVGKEELYDGE